MQFVRTDLALLLLLANFAAAQKLTPPAMQDSAVGCAVDGLTG